MKFTVEIEDNWIDEEKIESELKRQVIAGVVAQIAPDFIKGHARLIGEVAVRNITAIFDAAAEEETKKFILEGKVQSYANSRNMVSVADYIKEKFESSQGYNSQKDIIEKMAKNYSIEMKNRYDMMFASQIIIKMNEQGLLKEGVFDSLMKKN